MNRTADSVPGTDATEGYVRAERAVVDRALGALLDELLADVPAAVAAPIRYALGGEAKRLRPILCVAAFRAVRGGAAVDAIYTIAAALELIHTYSLVHDDLPCMDDDDLRRGRPATHREFGVRRATLAGAALIPLAFHAVERGGRRLGLEGRVRAALVAELARGAGAGGMVGGQWLDLRAEGRDSDAAELEAIHRRKTGALITAAVRLGGRAAGASVEVLDALDAYGGAVGLAFQITDDVLDVTASSAVLGKTAGKDAAVAKVTYPALLGVDGARRRARAEVGRALAAVREADVATPDLERLARYAVDRGR